MALLDMGVAEIGYGYVTLDNEWNTKFYTAMRMHCAQDTVPFVVNISSQL